MPFSSYTHSHDFLLVPFYGHSHISFSTLIGTILIKENSKPQDLTAYADGSVTKYQSGWGFTGKQGATTIHKDSAAYTISTSSLTIEVEVVTHALRWIASRGGSQTTHAILLTDTMSFLQKVNSGMGSPDWNVSTIDIHLRKLLWVYCPGHAGVKRNDRADRLAGKATLTSGLILGRSEVLRSLRHYLRAQSQGLHTTDRLEER